MKDSKSYRMSQGQTTFGVGSIIGIGDESFINTGVTDPDSQNHIIFPRLEERLGVFSLRYPRIKYERRNNKKVNVGNKFNFRRFPSWMFCPSCRMMKYITPAISNELNGKVPYCSNSSCKNKGKTRLQSMRFVIACEHGHLDEFPWKFWAHSRQNENIAEKGNCQQDNLFFKVRTGLGAGWASIVVSCASCGASRSLSDLNANPDALKSIGQTCRGKQPWQPASSNECGETPRVSQKNASNIYQPVIVSAIDIEVSESVSTLTANQANIKGHVLFDRLVRRFEDNGAEDTAVLFLIDSIVEDVNCSVGDVLDLLQSNEVIDEEDSQSAPKNIFELNQGLQEDEYPVFFKNITSKKFINKIEKIDNNLSTPESKVISSLFDHISLVKKLREVRAFKGFNRLQFDPGKIVPPSLDLKPTWLPAVEVFGEGIFLSINQAKLDDWYIENKASIDNKMDLIMRRYTSKNNEDRFGPFSAKFILLHTLSHILIRQLSFESGYNASALRESIYFSDEVGKKMSGILIYTADSDSEGSLGGLVRQGQWERLLPTILLSIEKASWCSSDPVCGESEGQGHDGLNQGACHACGLISETSCTHLNSLLSRTLLIDKEIGFFSDIV